MADAPDKSRGAEQLAKQAEELRLATVKQAEEDAAARYAHTEGRLVMTEGAFSMKTSGAKIGTHPDEPGDNSVEPHPDFKLTPPPEAP